MFFYFYGFYFLLCVCSFAFQVMLFSVYTVLLLPKKGAFWKGIPSCLTLRPWVFLVLLLPRGSFLQDNKIPKLKLRNL